MMALADYYLCDVCEAKAFYDANLNYDFDERVSYGCQSKLERVGDMKVICDDCAAKYEVVLVPRAALKAEAP
jgi:predicted amidophosphoribosyltransferase